MNTPGIVIVGAGQSAAVAAHTLREHGYAGRLTMIGREPHRPYERPPLSKAVLVEAETPRLDVLTEEAWARARVEFLSGCDAIVLDVANRQVHLANGQAVAYEKCLLATGGEPRRVPCLPCGDHVHSIRTLEDALRLKAALRNKPALAILGGGFLGLEVAHSSLASGAAVTVLERAGSLLDRFLPAAASTWLEAELRSARAQLFLNESLRDAQATPGGRLLLTTDTGRQLEVDEVVVAVGLLPNDALAREAGLAIAMGGGVLVDDNCRTSNDLVFACGDCANQKRPGQAAPSRLESWQNANEQARVAAAGMLGIAPPATPVPWFWTDQGRHNIQILGSPAADLDYVCRGVPAHGKALWIGHRRQVPVHAVGINAGADLRALRPLLESRRRIDLQHFHLDSVNLRAWVRQQLADAVAVP